jgi:hypothetical protein
MSYGGIFYTKPKAFQSRFYDPLEPSLPKTSLSLVCFDHSNGLNYPVVKNSYIDLSIVLRTIHQNIILFQCRRKNVFAQQDFGRCRKVNFSPLALLYFVPNEQRPSSPHIWKPHLSFVHYSVQAHVPSHSFQNCQQTAILVLKSSECP